jgi:hypothetical protein
MVGSLAMVRHSITFLELTRSVESTVDEVQRRKSDGSNGCVIYSNWPRSDVLNGCNHRQTQSQAVRQRSENGGQPFASESRSVILEKIHS